MANNLLLPNTIIAGTNKAGTTSIFRYLGDHPEVCGASVKEIRFFAKFTAENIQEHLIEYSEYFHDCNTDSRIIIEASPQYLEGGGNTARLIYSCIPEAKLIFVLREPVDRILSFFRRHYQRNSDFLSGLDSDEFLDKAIMIANNALPAEPNFRHVARQVASVQYASLLKEYSKIFPPEQIHIDFFDHLTADTGGFMGDICQFLDINPDFFSNYEFHIENKTRSYRFQSIQSAVFRINMLLEPLLNSKPALRRRLRSIYNKLNQTKKTAIQFDPSRVDKLRTAFSPYNAELAETLLQERPGLVVPKWLQTSQAD